MKFHAGLWGFGIPYQLQGLPVITYPYVVDTSMELPTAWYKTIFPGHKFWLLEFLQASSLLVLEFLQALLNRRAHHHRRTHVEIDRLPLRLC